MSQVNINNLTYNFSPKAQKNLWILFGVGLVMLILGVILWHAPEAAHGHAEGAEHHDDHSGSLGQRLWANLLVNGYFFGGISLAALFFYAMQYAAQASWSTVFMRMFSAVSDFLWIGMVTIGLVLLAGQFHLNHIYHWQDPAAYDGDPIMQHKQPYFEAWFFWLRFLLFVGGWIWYQRWSRKNSIAEDLLSNWESMADNWRKNLKNAAIFLVFFGFTSSVFTWDVIMSIDTHWYSTLFGWYNFAGWWIAALVAFNLLAIHLKSRGQFEFVNPSHMHDLGKWMFAVSFLWTYLWFSQFMLIWYSNIPEEVVYYAERWENYRGLFWITMLVNFAFPMLVLMSRDSKRNKSYVFFVGLLIMFFHWTDTFLLVMPGTVHANWGIGLIEIGMFLAFISFFVFWTLRALSKAPILAKNHALLPEGIHHHQ